MGLTPMRFLPATRVKGEDLRECGIVAGRRTSQCRQCAKNSSGSVVRVRACCLEFAAPIDAGHSDGRIDWATGCTVDGHTAPRGCGARVARDEPGLSERTRMILVLTLSVGQRLTTDSPDRAQCPAIEDRLRGMQPRSLSFQADRTAAARHQTIFLAIISRRNIATRAKVSRFGSRFAGLHPRKNRRRSGMPRRATIPAQWPSMMR